MNRLISVHVYQSMSKRDMAPKSWNPEALAAYVDAELCGAVLPGRVAA